MSQIQSPSRRSRSGFSMIGLLLVVVILFVLAGYYFQSDESGQKPGVGGYVQESQKAVGMVQSSIGRAKGVAEIEHLRIIQGAVDQWAMDHPGERCTLQALQQAGHNIPTPPAGCRFDIDANNQAVVVEVQPAAPPLSPGPGGNAPPPLPGAGK